MCCICSGLKADWLEFLPVSFFKGPSMFSVRSRQFYFYKDNMVAKASTNLPVYTTIFCIVSLDSIVVVSPMKTGSMSISQGPYIYNYVNCISINS